ncbi:hypothetical protein BASA81_015746 [Batrachochytrium salamandrivorans]|nr:hypothetical protein BASA81_015746 [Batrachochytrium salamandrivorans]
MSVRVLYFAKARQVVGGVSDEEFELCSTLEELVGEVLKRHPGLKSVLATCSFSINCAYVQGPAACLKDGDEREDHPPTPLPSSMPGGPKKMKISESSEPAPAASTATTELESDAHKMNLYSRQIGEYGIEAMGKLIKMRVLVLGMRGLGVEVAKNLVLAGPGAVHVYDPEFPTEADCGLNFFLSQANTETRGQMSAKELQKLNRLVEVANVVELTEQVVASFSVVVATNKLLPSEADKWNSFCRERGIGFVSADVFGASGYVFVDFGKQFSIRDVNGETPLSRLIAEFTSTGTTTRVKIVDDGRRHNLDESDHDGFVQFEEVGPVLKAGLEGKVFKIKHTQTDKKKFDAFSFEIEFDSTGLDLEGAQGRWTQVKRPVAVHFDDFAASKAAPCEGSFLFTDGAKIFRAEQLHVAFQALWQFQQENAGKLPTTTEGFTRCLELAKSKDAFDEQVVRNVVTFSSTELQPLSAFFGGVVAQEVVKLTGKYTPLKQWLHLDVFEVLNDDNGGVNRELVQVDVSQRQGDLRALLGDALCDKLLGIHTFQVGCGALGCEFLKNFALLGVACGSNGLITVTDNDRIEVSNLSRQFLFREENVGQSKSMAATNAVRKMNPQIQIQALELLVAANTESVFSNRFFRQQDFILNALDNVQARNYVDARCVFNEKALLESGTLGTKCNVQVILPFLTQSYTDGPKDAQSADIPMCTLRNFPSEIEHCIEWSRARFTDMFSVIAAQVNSFKQSPQEFLDKLKTANASSELSSLKDVVDLVRLLVNTEANTLERCVLDARDMFHERFHASVVELIASYPEDTLDSTGKRFWSGTKRFPQAIEFDLNNELHMTYMLATTNLLAFNRGLLPIGDELPLNSEYRQPQFVKTMLGKWQPKPSARTSSVATGAAGVEEEDATEEFSKLQAELTALVPQMAANTVKCEPAEFEKDSDLNFHIDFVYSCSNLRATNYRIKSATRHQTKMIAGKIIPALATTTASVCGLVMIEMLKLVQGKPLEAFKDSSNSLGVNGYFFSEPLQPNKAKNEYDAIEMCEVVCDPAGFSKWDKIKIETGGGITLQEFIGKFELQAEGRYKLTTLSHPSANVSTSSGFGKFIYESAPWDPKSKHEYDSRLGRPLGEVIDQVYGPGTVAEVTMLETAQSSPEDDSPIKVPTVVWVKA